MKQHKFGTAFLLLLLMKVVPLVAGQPWLQAFPVIAYDSTHAYFANDQWVAFYKHGFTARLITLPRDSLKTPLPWSPPTMVDLGGSSFSVDGRNLVRRQGDSANVFPLPPPTVEAIRALQHAGADAVQPVQPDQLTETLFPLLAYRERVWFGLTLSDGSRAQSVGGIGWFDPANSRFARIYSPALARYQPQWIGAADDTVRILFKRASESAASAGRLLAVPVRAPALIEVDPRGAGIPGKSVLAADFWGDTLLISTDEAVAVWKPRRGALVYTSRGYAAPTTQWMYLKTFPGGDATRGDSVRFLPLKAATPTEVKAKVGKWLQVVCPIGIEGYVDEAAWTRNSVLWSQRNWGCGDSLCLARLRVPMEGRFVETDFTNTALTRLGRDENGIKVGFRAAWVREDDVIPILMSP